MISSPHADWQSTLRDRGFRVTPQRQLVYEAVVALEHATPEELLAQVKRTADGVNLSTVYRALEVLQEVGLVRHTHLGHGAPTYHPAADSHHLHLVCRDCGSVTEADVTLADGLVGSLDAAHGFDTDVHHFAIYGRCAACSAKLRDQPASGRTRTAR
jgi:Fur family ferric uptake transcriptional regulator